MAWQPETDQTIVISTRIRLARNFAAYPFPTKIDDAQAAVKRIFADKALNDEAAERGVVPFFRDEKRVVRFDDEKVVDVDERDEFAALRRFLGGR